MNIFIKYWPPEDCPADNPKLGLDWGGSKASYGRPFSIACLDLIFFGRSVHINFVTNGRAYAKEFRDWAGIPLFPCSYRHLTKKVK